MTNVNDYQGFCDSDRIEAAIADCHDGMLLIPKRDCKTESERAYWLIDRAILLPENTTVIIENCKIKLSDRCRDNFFRSANSGFGFEETPLIHNINIRGVGTAVLEGAEHPRSTGDGSKILACPCPKNSEDLIKLADWIPEERKLSGKLTFDDNHDHSYGTDAGVEGESHNGDWRDIGILLANVENFSIENLRMIDYHGWGISLEACAYGRIRDIDFDTCMAKMIDGMLNNTENQDGIDLRNGCHDIIISDITGGTGDDLIALTAIVPNSAYIPGGSLCSTHVMHNDWTRRETGIHDVIIRNVKGYSKGHCCWLIRLLPASADITNVVIDGVIDTSPEGFRAGGVFLLGMADGAYGSGKVGTMSNITISNAICKNNTPLLILGKMKDSVISNIVNSNPNVPVIKIGRTDGFENVTLQGITTVGKEIIHSC